MKNVGAAAFITDDRGRVLLVKHTYGRLNWELPGDAGEPNESPVETAIREVEEETGLVVEARYTTGSYYSSENDSLHFVFWCTSKNPDADPFPDNDEISARDFFSIKNLPRPISDWTLRRIKDADEGNLSQVTLTIGPRVWLE